MKWSSNPENKNFNVESLPTPLAHLSLCISWWKSRTVGRVFFGASRLSKGKSLKKKTSIHSPIILYSWSSMCFYYLKHSPSTKRAPSCLTVKPSSEQLFPQKQKNTLIYEMLIIQNGTPGPRWKGFRRLPCPTGGLWVVFSSSSAFPHPNSAWYHYTSQGYQLSENADCNASLVSVKIYNYAHLTSFQGQMEVISLVWNNNLAMHQCNWKKKRRYHSAYLSPCRKCTVWTANEIKISRRR